MALVLSGATINLRPKPRSFSAAGGIDFVSVKSWNERLMMLDVYSSVDMLARWLTAF